MRIARALLRPQHDRFLPDSLPLVDIIEKVRDGFTP